MFIMLFNGWAVFMKMVVKNILFSVKQFVKQNLQFRSTIVKLQYFAFKRRTFLYNIINVIYRKKQNFEKQNFFPEFIFTRIIFS